MYAPSTVSAEDSCRGNDARASKILDEWVSMLDGDHNARQGGQAKARKQTRSDRVNGSSSLQNSFLIYHPLLCSAEICSHRLGGGEADGPGRCPSLAELADKRNSFSQKSISSHNSTEKQSIDAEIRFIRSMCGYD